MDIYCGTTSIRDSRNAPSEKDRTRDKDWTPFVYSDNMEILVPAEGVELYFFSGADMLEVVRRYNLFCGGGFIPARRGLGFWNRVKMTYSADEALADLKEFRARGYPVSVLGLEPGWQSNAYPCTFEWNRERFPNPAEFVKKVSDMGIDVNLWTNGYVSKKSPLYEILEKYFADHTVWSGTVPDFSMPEVRKVFSETFKKIAFDIGVVGLKLDENDGDDVFLYPDTTIFPSGLSAEQFRQTQAVFMQRMVFDVSREMGLRTFGLVRGTNAGTQSLPFVIYTDYRNHSALLAATANASFIGILFTPEASRAATGGEWLRRIQADAWSALAMINAWSSGQKPWTFPDVADVVKDAMILRESLMPYLYNAFARYRENGTPPVRAMMLEKSFTDMLSNPAVSATVREKALRLKDQWMFGADILVAPMPVGKNSREVILPEGKWYDFYTGAYVGSAQVVTVNYEDCGRRAPVYVRNGAIVAMSDLAAVGARGKLILRHYGEAEGLLEFYDDDGKTDNYLKGDFVKLTFQVRRGANGEMVGEVCGDISKLYNYASVGFLFMTK